MRTFHKLKEVRISDVKAQGWLKEFLVCQKEGMPGHLHEIGYPYDRFCWQYRTLTEGGYAEWWPYEQTAYFIDTVVRTAGFIDDKELLEVVMGQIESSLSNDTDPYIGPFELKEARNCSRWPHAIYFRALYALWSYTGDERYLEKMRAHYLADIPEHYCTSRNYANIEMILRLAEYFDDSRLFELAKAAFEKFQENQNSLTMDRLNSDIPPTGHMVSYNEDSKIPAIMYLYTGEKEYLEATLNAYKKVEIYHMLPDGIHSCSEGPNGNDAWRAHESCDLSDYTWSLGFLLEATGNGKYADMIERVCLNALPGATGHHFKTIQYFSSVNQVISARNSTHLASWYNTPRMAYQPHHYPECCVGNIGRAMPNYVLRMYQETDEGIAASLYGDSIYDGKYMRLEQSGGYPFSSKTSFHVTVKDDCKNKLMLRIPSWTKGYILKVNGKKQTADEWNGYITVEVQDHDLVELEFRMALTMESTPDNGFYYNYGPFLMALKIEEKEEIDLKEPRQTKEFPAYNIYPGSKWNYAVKRFDVDERPVIKWKEIDKNPFWDGYPLEITVKARELKNWELVEVKNDSDVDKKVGEGIDRKQVECGASEIREDLLLTPRIPDPGFIAENLGEEVDITLVPYGCTKLRITVFPKYSLDAVNWFDFLGK